MTETMRVAKSEYTRYSLLIGTLMIISVGVLEQLPKRNHHTIKNQCCLRRQTDNYALALDIIKWNWLHCSD